MDSVQPRIVNQVSIHNFSLELSNTEEIISFYEMWLVLTISQENSEGKTLTPTPRSATAREMIKALVLVRSRRLLQTRKIMEPFPAAATTDNV
ncbi:unnamed protein product [Porites lobata]|uniref:Uncharacterized protein n=1 Tax=Porites lobata TaxID=104759 RepID=A0ABN8N295_9CNID|nr:unnamed protein product [Porites lobata]